MRLFATANGVALYAPRARAAVLSEWTLDQAKRFEAATADDKSWSEVFPERTLSSGGPSSLVSMAIMPTARCNFSCGYCYAAAAHGSATLSELQIRAAIAYYYGRWGGPGKSVSICILGGGEPLVAPQTTRAAMRIARETEQATGTRARVSLVTNGSLIDVPLATDMMRWNITPRISFDILPDLQRKQRGDYGAVVRGLRNLAEAGLQPEIRTVITAQSVGRLPEMVERVAQAHPEVHVMRADPVAGAEERNGLTLFEQFPEAFAAARRLARQYGIALDCMPWRLPFWGATSSFCVGEFGISPEGTLGICHRKSSCAELSAAGWNFGAIAVDGTMRIDETRLAALTSPVAIPFACRACVLAECCRGGCRATRILRESSVIRRARCNMLRRCFDLAAEEWLEWHRETGGTT